LKRLKSSIGKRDLNGIGAKRKRGRFRNLKIENEFDVRGNFNAGVEREKEMIGNRTNGNVGMTVR
jgi:hypothetical protein